MPSLVSSKVEKIYDLSLQRNGIALDILGLSTIHLFHCVSIKGCSVRFLFLNHCVHQQLFRIHLFVKFSALRSHSELETVKNASAHEGVSVGINRYSSRLFPFSFFIWISLFWYTQIVLFLFLLCTCACVSLTLFPCFSLFVDWFLVLGNNSTKGKKIIPPFSHILTNIGTLVIVTDPHFLVMKIFFSGMIYWNWK